METNTKMKNNILYGDDYLTKHFSISKVKPHIKNDIKSPLDEKKSEKFTCSKLINKVDRIINKNPISIPTYEELFK